jgi:general secretion pathway protein G
MRTSSASQPADSPPRAGFTLLELLAVVAVIAILLALLLPAIMGAGNKARIVQTKVEIGGLAKSIADFKVKYGLEPPSFIRLYETGSDWTSVDPNPTQQAIKVSSRTTISRLWPQFDFSLNRDINDDSNTTGTFDLHGSECLVFFLGGVVKWNDTYPLNMPNGTRDPEDQYIPMGFSRNPANPFDNSGTNRDRFYEFSIYDRLVRSSSNANFFGYSDPIPGTPVPYLYINSNEGQGYNVSDFGGTLDHPPGLAANSVYLNGATTSSPAWNPNGFQIISAGLDRKYGGGPGAASPTFAGPYQKGDLPIISGNATDRDFERDNITNFSDGVLVP